MTPINGRRNRKGDAWGKKIPKLNQRRGCLRVLIPIGPRRTPTAGRPVHRAPAGRPAREEAS